MKIKERVKISDRINAVGTHLQGYINIKYSKLVKKLGKPTSNGDGYKVDAQWKGNIDGKVFTIYNYKDGKNYNGRNGTPTKDITDWHIGGFDRTVVTELKIYLGCSR